jgi:hypothetical protein
MIIKKSFKTKVKVSFDNTKSDTCPISHSLGSFAARDAGC